MKLKQWLYGATALAMLAACSDKDVAPGGDNPSNTNGSDENATGYIAVQINLPQNSGTRAKPNGENEENDQFDDGLWEEYQVNNAMIVLFKGTTENNATFSKAVNLTKPFFENDPTDDNITSSYIAAIPVSALGTNEHYWGLAILNRDANTIVAAGEKGTSEGVKIAGNPLTAGTTNFATVLGWTSEIEFINDGYFFMTNAPLSKVAGNISSADGNIQYLADLGTQTYQTMAAAKEHRAGCIYVERAVAKVTAKIAQNAGSFLTFVDKDGKELTGEKKPSVEADVTYILNNTNKISYVVRNVQKNLLGDHFDWNIENNGRYRMIGSENMHAIGSPYHENVQNLYRTYWCHDPNYNINIYNENNPEDGNSNVLKSATFEELTTPLYCRENTFDVKHQNYGNTTLAVFKVDFTVKQGTTDCPDLYIKDGNYEKIYISKEDAAAPEINAIYTDSEIKKALELAYKASGKTGDLNNAEEYLDIQFGTKDNALWILDIDLKTGGTSPFNDNGYTAYRDYLGYADGTTSVNKRDDDFNIVKDGDGNNVTVVNNKLKNFIDGLNKFTNTIKFTGGVSYYQIPIKHFGDYYCPWDKTITGITTEAVYNAGVDFGTDKSHAVKYLGRYGMVRNNWYELNISKFTGLGSPNFPEIDLTLSDDNNEVKRYIAIEIHTLAWAKRTQNVDF